MTTPQKLLTTFNESSTAFDVLAGVDLRGKFAVVTGGYSGIGLEMTRALVSAGADVLVPARRPAVAKAVLENIASVRALDLTDPVSINRFSSELISEKRDVDILINAAGVMKKSPTMVGPGWESHLAIHHLGPFLLTQGLMPVIAAEGRVIGLSSSAHFLSDIQWDDLHFEKPGTYDQWRAYGQSKTAVALFSLYLDGILSQRGAHAYSVHPGSILTPLQREIPREEQVRQGWIDSHGNAPDGFKSPEQGAATAVWAATSPLLVDHGGSYLQDCNLATSATSKDMLVGGVMPWATDPSAAARLWQLSEQIVAKL